MRHLTGTDDDSARGPLSRSAPLGVVLAGGMGTRLRPLTDSTNKHLLDVAGVPMIAYGLRALAGAGVREAVVVTGSAHGGAFEDVLAEPGRYGLDRIELALQAEPRGIADALLCVRSRLIDQAADRDLLVLLGDNLFGASLEPLVRRFREGSDAAMVALARHDDPGSYGVARLSGDRVAEIVEKPGDDPPSSWVVPGVYMYRCDVFDEIGALTPSARGELEITDLNNRYAARGALGHVLLDEWWADAGTPEGLARAERLIRAHGVNGSARAGATP